MAYRLRYIVNVDWVSPGIGLGQGQYVNNPGIAVGAPTNAQTLAFVDAATPYSTTFTATDVTNLLSALTTDISAQMNAQLTRVQGFSSGGS